MELVTPTVHAFRHAPSGSYAYVVVDPGTRTCAVIDPVLDDGAVDEIVEWIVAAKVSVAWILDTHVHADHFSAAAFVRRRLGGRTAMGSGLRRLYEYLNGSVRPRGAAYDVLLEDGAELRIGELAGRALHTPGHTPSCTTYVLGYAAFVGDALLMPDVGTGRCDFPGGSARALFASAQRLFELPAATRVFVGHDYGRDGQRVPASETTMCRQRAENVHLGGRSLEEFVAMREARDATLPRPAMMDRALPFNLPPAPMMSRSAGLSACGQFS